MTAGRGISFLFHKNLRDCGRKTSERYDELGQYAIRRFGDVPLDGLTTEQLQTDVGRLLDHGGREYVPEVFAAMIIGYNQGKFEFGSAADAE